MAKDVMQQIAAFIANKLGKKYGFFVMVYELNNGDGRSNYVSNSNREDVVKAMKEFIDRTEESSWGTHKL